MTASILPSRRPGPVQQTLSLLSARPLESAGAGVLALAACLSVAAFATGHGTAPAQPEAAETAPAAPSVQDMTPFAVRRIDPTEAQKLNAAVPLANGPNPAAAPFVLKADSKTYGRALECLTQAIYYEAAREPEEGQRAVAQVVLNRMRHPAYPASVCAVVYQGAERPTGCQFSFTCDGSLARAPMRDYWDRARRIADEALKGHVAASVGNATHYHADYVAPYWAPTLTKSAVIGAHIFYRWRGDWGQPAAFTQKWVKRESDPAFLRSAALAAEARYAAMAPVGEVVTTIEEARAKLPPELARLVEPEIAAGGGKRVALRLEARRKVEEATRDPKPVASGSSSLNWGLTGSPAGEAEQAPLGRKPAATTTAVAAGGAAPSGAE
ncbi:cell wall hydrolase [Sphingomonas humi]|uniref:Cell wall hydrolase SleB domain-containing protein n=1 Tax=Sphingomonas humi TaxID=335630 RepID=A0ABP7S3U3_9SPHN